MVAFVPKRSGVGVVEIFGPIGGGAQVTEQAKLLESVRTNRRMKALLIDIDSPGGSVGGSEILYARLERVARDKPVVAFIRGLGASGAYLLSCTAVKIVSIPSALVGSIGVLYVRPVLQELLERIGVGLSVYKGGRLKDMTGFWRSTTAEEDDKFKAIIEEIHESFISSVAKGRNMDIGQVREIATGEVFTGRKAKELGLVDELGDFDRALELAAELGQVKPKPLWVRPRRSFAERLAGGFGRSMAAGVVSEFERGIPGGLYYGAPWLNGGGWR